MKQNMKQNMKQSIKLLLAGLFASLGSPVLADITVDKSNGILSISSDIEGTVVAKVIAPNDEVVVDERYSGNSFSWVPSSGPDGAYRYDVRVFDRVDKLKRVVSSAPSNNSDYAGGSVEVMNGQIATGEE